MGSFKPIESQFQAGYKGNRISARWVGVGMKNILRIELDNDSFAHFYRVRAFKGHLLVVRALALAPLSPLIVIASSCHRET